MTGILFLFNSTLSFSQCNNGITAGTFDQFGTGEYAAPDYIAGWKAWGTDRIKIVTQGTSNGALIRSRDDEQFSLQQTIYSAKASFTYSLTFTFGNWTNGCNTSARAALQVEVYADNSALPFFRSEVFNANDKSTAETKAIQFTTPASVSTLRVRVFDPGSPKPTCGAVIDDITLVSPLIVSTSSASVTCFGDTNGSFSVYASGGAAPYTASYSGNGSELIPITLLDGHGNVTGLASGNYVLHLTDANNCSVEKTIVVSQPSASLTLTTSPVICYGESTGSVLASAAGGTPGYTYTLGSETNQTGLFENLPPGTYSVTATDRNSCTISASFSIIQPPAPLSATAAVTTNACFQQVNGGIQVSGQGGIAPYRYMLNGMTNTNGTFTNLAAGSYTITVSDANNCITSIPATVQSSEGITVDVQKRDVACFGGSDGSITITSARNVSYSYTLMGVTNTTGKFSNLSSGTYTVRVSDTNCYADIVIAISQPVSQLSAIASPLRCFGEATGTITVTASGGTPGYTYTLGGISNNTGTFTNLVAGTYEITVSDARGCTTLTAATIGEAKTPVTLSGSVFNNNCKGGSSGSLTVVASGGLPGYTYFMDGASNTTGTFENLPAGTYTVFVKDQNGCPSSIVLSVAEPAVAISAEVTTVPARCKGEPNGAITITGSGGTPGYTYRLDANRNSTGTFTGLTTGTYSILITDAIGCTTAVSATVSEPEAEVSARVKNSWCLGEPTGTVAVEAFGGTPGYRYTLNGITNTTGSFSGLTAARYSIVVTDINNCSVVVETTLSTPTSVLSGTILQKQDVACYGEASGQVQLSAAGGIPGYTFSINGITNTTGLFPNLPSGSYIGVITDANGCSTTVSFLIRELSSEIRASYTSSAVKCAGEANGTITVTASGGAPGYTFTLNGQSNTTGVFNSLEAGDHTILISDQRNCTVSLQARVSGPSKAISVIARPVKCFGQADGAIVISATGGTPGYAFHLNGTTNTTGRFENLAAGTYQIVVTDANDCSTIASATIAEPTTSLTVFLTSKTDVTCFGEASGAVTLRAQGGVPGYTYSVNETTNTSGIFTGLAGGSYIFSITDQNGCVAHQEVTISQPSARLAAEATAISPTCSSESNGSITVLATGGTGAYTYDLNGMENTTGRFLNLPPGTYSILVNDANNCAVVTSATVSQPEPITVSAQVLNVSCFGEKSGTIRASGRGGSSSYTYILNDERNNTGLFTGLAAGSYLIYVIDSNGCTGVTTATIAQPEPLIATIVTADMTKPGQFDGTATITSKGGTGTYTYTFDRINETNTTGYFQNLAPGRYAVTVTDSKGCSALVDFTIEQLNLVELTPALTQTPEGKQVSIAAKLREPFTEDVSVTLSYRGAASQKSDYLLIDQFQKITIPKGALTSTEKTTIHALSDAQQEPDEDVQVTITSTSNRLVQIGSGATVIIQDISPDDPLIDRSVPENKDLFPDPLVSPNDDGEGNNFFNIGNIASFPENEVLIFNRWGNVVFRISGYNTTDKVFRGFSNTGLLGSAPKALVEGVYYYVIYTYKSGQSGTVRRLNKGYLILKR